MVGLIVVFLWLGSTVVDFDLNPSLSRVSLKNKKGGRDSRARAMVETS